jgi:hypothetical protein
MGVNKVVFILLIYQTHTFSKTKEKKWSYIYFQKEKKRKNREVNYAQTHHWWETYVHNKNNNLKVKIILS